MEAGQLPAGLLPGMEYLPAETLVVQLAARGSDGAVFSRLPDHAGEPLVDTVQYIDLSKVRPAAAGEVRGLTSGMARLRGCHASR